ncbi:glycosyltransferase [Photobacterium sp. Alg240-V54]|uniref:glycosyltransferase n=1 Tax=Photobacterium sp. Alg240-V54 TaxID=2305995 RepID=UPI0013CFF236|nr:glycosyltransferase [Photobacterium sp. Alg240-V54]
MNFSVLMSVYYKDDDNQLFEAIESIINNTVVPNQIVIVVDGKVGCNIQKILDLYAETPLFNIIYLESNVGLGNALNIGLSYCKYEVVARMDSDDLCHIDRFEKQVKYMSDYDIVGGNISEFDKDPLQPYSQRKVPLENDEIIKFSRRRCPFNHVTVMYKKSQVIAAGGYIGGRNFQEDYYLWIRMLNNRCRSKNIDFNLVNVRAGSDMLYRRTGCEYAKNEIIVQYNAYNLGFISLFDFIFNSIIRSCTRLSPIFIKKIIYSKLR